MPWIPCHACNQTEKATSLIFGRRWCQRCLDRRLGVVVAARLGQRKPPPARPPRCDDTPGPWGENAVRAMEDAAADLE